VPAALVLAAACGKPAADEAAAAKTQAVVGASVATIKTERFVETVDAIGTVISRPGHVASLAAPAPTRVTGTPVSLGAHVQKGDLLVELDRSPFEAAAKSADAALTAAQSAADRALRLADAGVSPRREAEQAAAELAQARMNAQAAHRALDLSAIRSPIDGIVTKMNAVLGAAVDVGQPLVEVTDASVLDVALTLSVTDAARVKTGQAVALHAGSDASGASVASGRVVDVSGTVDSASLGVIARVELTAGANAVRIGQTLFGTIGVGEHANAVVVPAEALVPTGEGFKVFVVDVNGIAHSRPVKVGGRSDRGVWVTDGLTAGETVVTRGAFGVDDNAKVDIKAASKAESKMDTKAARKGGL
jgi:membrane fusion protein (multidrug efflux system)